MQKVLLWLAISAQVMMTSAANRFERQHPVPPGVREADKQTNPPIEPPAKFKQKPTDPAILKQEADELARLSAGVPSDIGLIAQGQLPKDLADKLKRIEKLAKRLRNELSR